MSEVSLRTEPHTFEEIHAQADICQVTLQRADERLERIKQLALPPTYSDIIFTGCGSSLHLGRCAAAAWSELLERPVWAVPASELLHFAHFRLHRYANPLIVAISRTGGTTETVRAVVHLRNACDATPVAVTTEPKSEMGKVCDLELAFTECRERSVVMTGAFTAILYGLLLAADGLAGGKHRDALGQLPVLLNRVIAESEAICRQVASDGQLKRFVFLGSGPMFGLANEASLKLTEMALEPVSVYPTLEFRHGPIAALDPDTLVTILPVEAEIPYLPTLVEEVVETGARLLVVSDKPLMLCLQLNFRSGLREIFLPVLFAHVVQLLAFWRAIEHGYNPDAPPHLRRTVTLED